jgi:sugar lactone lactonase YvrE
VSRPARGHRRSQAPDILIDAGATLAEGPVWDDQRQQLLWVDILPGLVHRFDPATGGDDVVRAGKPVGAVGLRRAGGLVLTVSRCWIKDGGDCTRLR